MTAVGSIRITVSGSFRRHMDAIRSDVEMFTNAGAAVLSPADPRVVDVFDEFVFVASDRQRTVKTLQDRHFAAIEGSSLLWLVAPDGYVGNSVAMEVGFAIARGVPVLCATPVSDLNVRQQVQFACDPAAAVGMARRSFGTPCRGIGVPPAAPLSLTLDPTGGANFAHDLIERRRDYLLRRDLEHREKPPAEVAQVEEELLRLIRPV